MKQQGVFAAVVSLLVLFMGATSARAQSGPCSEKTLSGDYGFTITGQILAGPAAGQVTGVAMTHFDGQGNLQQVDHVVHNGALPAVEWRPGTGTYTVNDDCTGAAVINFSDGSPSLNLRFVLAKRGSEIRTVVSNPGTAITSIGTRRETFF
jgi:hypothetical protein